MDLRRRGVTARRFVLYAAEEEGGQVAAEAAAREAPEEKKAEAFQLNELELRTIQESTRYAWAFIGGGALATALPGYLVVTRSKLGRTGKVASVAGAAVIGAVAGVMKVNYDLIRGLSALPNAQSPIAKELNFTLQRYGYYKFLHEGGAIPRDPNGPMPARTSVV
eukprot:CAMPEP_0114624540 /NCGR_PEP_ID=MMETSP0168-20121206/10817_1 /TAXON_ID=95228 ORGANISM="Vannella sp., Strain DIVA3 517/6/12" /NCGR_SAMPLE_ID=MMETSP0168 /ASSEMBLY_ACC=CAM_ASM_000044 /LENGTH=164 /DNA_ID=CAMNT_0001835813 /DNA_START=43 /DNA_END=533 /DNA_ORIENTATION=-